jgi:hypothetical protein
MGGIYNKVVKRESVFLYQVDIDIPQDNPEKKDMGD